MRRWAKKALSKKMPSAEVTIRVVDIEEMSQLNFLFRNKGGPTNVLSFPLCIPDTVCIEVPILGDIVICATIVNKEAEEQGKANEAHWAHMIVHGVYHLLGYDHQTNQDAEMMEALEIATLKELGFENPYES